MIEYINDDLMNVREGMILHGCNCSGGFGSGVAGAIRRTYPIVYEIFKDYPTGTTMLGQFVPIEVDNNLIIGNCYTQLHYGSDGRKYASIDAIKKSLTDAFKYAARYSITTISLPKIGAGLGGLDWDSEVEPIIQSISSNYNSINTKVYYI